MKANRIQELAEQAGLLGPNSRVGNAHEATKKFAELIVQECAQYRIKPETKRDIEVFANANAYDWISFCNESEANIKFTFNRETGKLK